MNLINPQEPCNYQSYLFFHLFSYFFFFFATAWPLSLLCPIAPQRPKLTCCSVHLSVDLVHILISTWKMKILPGPVQGGESRKIRVVRHHWVVAIPPHQDSKHSRATVYAFSLLAMSEVCSTSQKLPCSFLDLKQHRHSEKTYQKRTSSSF